MNRLVLLATLSLAFATFLLAPGANALGSVPTFPACVYGVTAPTCFGGHDVCSPYFSLQVPICVDIPGCHHFDCISAQSEASSPLVGAPCVAGYTASSCLYGYDICGPTFSEEVPYCTNVPLCPHWECD